MKFKIMNMNVMFLNKFHHKRFLNMYNFLKDAAAYKKKKFLKCVIISPTVITTFFYIKDIINVRISCPHVVVAFPFMLIH